MYVDTTALLLGALLSYIIVVVVYRLVFHPLAAFPGPRLAAATQWYEAFFDLCRAPGGTYVFEIDRMHVKYGKSFSVDSCVEEHD
jgi:hypothetical protein